MRGEQILVVEDNTALCDAIRTLLERNGYDVMTATNGREALRVMENCTPDLVVADINMPIMDGYDFYKAVRANPAWRLAPFVFLTALAEREDVLRGKALGVEDYLVKPLDIEELLTVIRAKLDRTRVVLETKDAEILRTKEQIARALNHELRTPLTWITAYTELAMDYLDTLPPEELRAFLGQVLQGGERIERLANDLLMLIRMDNGQLRAQLQQAMGPCDVGTVVGRVVKARRADAAAQGVALQATVPESLPDVLGCEEFLVDALARLTENAIKFSTTPNSEVRLTASQADGHIEITVADQGVGIAPGDLSKLFDRFHQVNRDRQEQQGVGLGLAIAHELVTLHGGEIRVKSEPGVGSTFTIRLPVADVPGDL